MKIALTVLLPITPRFPKSLLTDTLQTASVSDKKVHGPEFFLNPAAEESDLMKEANEISKTLTPVFNETGCCGHILRTAKGFKACDANDRLIGVFETAGLGIVALLDAASDAA